MFYDVWWLILLQTTSLFWTIVTKLENNFPNSGSTYCQICIVSETITSRNSLCACYWSLYCFYGFFTFSAIYEKHASFTLLTPAWLTEVVLSSIESKNNTQTHTHYNKNHGDKRSLTYLLTTVLQRPKVGSPVLSLVLSVMGTESCS